MKLVVPHRYRIDAEQAEDLVLGDPIGDVEVAVALEQVSGVAKSAPGFAAFCAAMTLAALARPPRVPSRWRSFGPTASRWEWVSLTCSRVMVLAWLRAGLASSRTAAQPQSTRRTIRIMKVLLLFETSQCVHRLCHE
jgi:hypothetical protein